MQKDPTPKDIERIAKTLARAQERDFLSLIDVAGQVNSGRVENVIDTVGYMKAHDHCSSCKGRTKVELHANSRGVWVGECPHCGCVIFYVSLPYRACGKMGPYPLAYGENFKFYYRVEHLGDLYVEIQKDEDGVKS